MKKYLILSSFLALAACHDGGHSHSGGGIIEMPEFVTPAQQMPTDVQSWAINGGVATDGSVTTFGGGDIFTFTLADNGEITAIQQGNRTYARDGDKNAYINVSGDEVRTINLALLGKEAGLSYADFGYMQETEIEPGNLDRDFDVFAGGYASKEYKDAVTSATYKGTAVAYIESDSVNGIANKITKTDDATLSVDALGRNTFSMNFSNADNPWYDVKVTDGKFSFSGGENIAPEFTMTDSMQANVQDTYVQTKYFDEGREVTATMGFDARDNATGREIDFEGAFGGIRQ